MSEQRLRYLVEIDRPSGATIHQMTSYIKDALTRRMWELPGDVSWDKDTTIWLTVKLVPKGKGLAREE
jgi:hypothetical protein